LDRWQFGNHNAPAFAIIETPMFSLAGVRKSVGEGGKLPLQFRLVYEIEGPQAQKIFGRTNSVKGACWD